MYPFVALSLAVGASALSIPRSTCTFTLTASGGQSGSIGQLSDGQNRIGGGLAAASFSINNSGITDAAGRGCILTPSVEQFQCDETATPTSGFTIESNGTVASSGSSIFYACPASDTEWNLYKTPVTGQTKCVQIALTASGCGATSSSSTSIGASTETSTVSTAPSTPVASIITPEAATVTVYQCSSEISLTSAAISTPSAPSTISEVESSSVAASSTLVETSETVVPTTAAVSSTPVTITGTAPSSSEASSTASSSTCASTTLTGTSTNGNYQYPHLIIPVSSSTPSSAAGTSYNGVISSNTSTIFNFDIPSSYSGKTCNLIFLLPEHDQLETSNYTSSGSGGIDFSQLSGVATETTTFTNQPSIEKDLGKFDITVGSSTLIVSGECAAGQAVSYELSAVGDTYLEFFQDWNPSPLGLYVTVC